MKKWDGKDATGRYQHPLEDVEYWNMTIDEGGTIYYVSKEEPSKQRIWCPASRLTKHLFRLEQIAAR